MVLEHQGIPTAPFAVVPALWDSHGPIVKTVSQLLERSTHAEELKDFPLFIKPACEGSSKGIYPFSKVTSPSELEVGVKKLQSRFSGQSILVEKYLAGNEYTVSLLGTGSNAEVLGSLQINWSNPADGGFFTVSNKNEGNDHLDQFVDAHNNPEVQVAEDLALRAWRALECCDVGRVDVRFGANGKPYVLEVRLTLPHARCRTNYPSSIHCLGCVRSGPTWYKLPSITVSVMRCSWGELSIAPYKDIRVCVRNEGTCNESEHGNVSIKGIIGLYSYNILASQPRTRGNHPRSRCLAKPLYTPK